MVENGKITAPVSIADVKQVLGAASNDVGVLCTHPNINIWSRYKPLHRAGLTYLGADNKEQYGVFYVANNGTYRRTYGIKPRQTTLVLLAAHVNVGDWQHDAPQGGESSPYRLTDFMGYNHNCHPNINIFAPMSIYSGTEGDVEILFAGVNASNINDDETSDEISPVWHKDFANSYLGIYCVYKQTDGTLVSNVTAVSEDTVAHSLSADGNVKCVISKSHFNVEGSVEVIPFLTPTRTVGSFVYSVPCFNYQTGIGTVTIKKSNFTATINITAAMFSGNQLTVSFSVTISTTKTEELPRTTISIASPTNPNLPSKVIETIPDGTIFLVLSGAASHTYTYTMQQVSATALTKDMYSVVVSNQIFQVSKPIATRQF